jgi:CIC family chloride channel protein
MVSRMSVRALRRSLHGHHRRLLRLAATGQRWMGGEATGLILLGALVGVVAGFAAVLFVLLVRGINSLVWSWSASFSEVVPGTALHAPDSPLPALYPVGVVAAGMLLVVLLVRRLSSDSGGHGVPEVMESVAQRSGRIRASVGWVKLLVSSLNIGLGGSVGKEGPIVQVGAAFGSSIGRFFGLHGRSVRTLVGCGAAAGVAAVFNAPIGGVMFALEIIVGSYSLSAFSPVLIASVAGSVTARRLLGEESAFAIPESLREGLTLVSPWEMGAYVVMGIAFGVLSVGFTRTIYFFEDGAHAWRVPAWLKAVVAGVLVGALGMALPQVLGEGHHTMSEVLVANASLLPWTLLLTLGVVKTLATSLTLAGGGSGGVFAPSLFVGAMFGGVFGQGLEALFPGSVGGFGAYALAGMAALLAGTAHAPMTGILLLFEMSGNYLLILPLMTAAVLSTVVAQRLMPYSLYTLGLSRRGVLLRDHQDTALLRELRVGDAMQPAIETIPETMTFDRIVRRLLQSDLHDFPVVDSRGQLTGAISLDDVREFLREEHLDQLLLARDCARPVITLHPSRTLLDAMEVFDQADQHEFPVVVEGRLIGSLTHAHVMSTYRRALMANTGDGTTQA